MFGAGHLENRAIFWSGSTDKVIKKTLTSTTTQQIPQLVSIGFSPFRYRILALLYDTLILIGLWGVTTALIVLIRGNVVTGALLQSILFIETFIFYCFFWIYKGQTIGMLAWRIRIESEKQFTLRAALFRYCGELLSLLTLGLGYYWVWIDSNRRSWSDIFSGTTVVRYRREVPSIDPSQQDETAQKNDEDG